MVAKTRRFRPLCRCFVVICPWWGAFFVNTCQIEKGPRMQLFRVPVAWKGPSVVGLAVNVLHFDASNQTEPPCAAITQAYNVLSQVIPTGCSIVVPNSGDTIEDTTGALTGGWTSGGGGTVAGAAPAAAAAGVGGCIGWQTGGIVQGTKGPRRLRGRTFIVPLSSQVYEADGTILAASLDVLNTFATNLQAAGPLAVWHRPTKVAPASGTSYGVLSHRVRDKVAFLSSRRD